MNPLQTLNTLGQSVWLDFIRRELLESGALARLIADDAVTGVTSNPSIFEKAIAQSNDYDSAIAAFAGQGLDAKAAYEQLAMDDIRHAADTLAPVYERTQGADGYVSMEVAPTLARDTHGTVEEAIRLWSSIDRPNLMIKVPATQEGLPAIQTLIGEGINVNVTLLFSRDMYAKVVEAYWAGLERLVDGGGDAARVASVASLFVSRVESAVDNRLHEKLAADTGDEDVLMPMLGKAAVANSRLAYQHFRECHSETRWQALAARGARPQRLLWASTGTKNPAYSDVKYVEELIAPETVNTMPPATLEAFRDHGTAAVTADQGLEDAHRAMDDLASAGIDMDEVTDTLLEQGLESFETAFEKLLASVDTALRKAA